MAGDDERERHWREFGAWLRSEREERPSPRRRGHSMSMRELSERSGVAVTTIMQYERGYRMEGETRKVSNPQETTLHLVADALGITRAEMCERAGWDCTAPAPRVPPVGDADGAGLTLSQRRRLIAAIELLESIAQELGSAPR